MSQYKLKQWLWVIPRLIVLTPLALLVVLGEWANEAFDYLSDRMPPEGKDD